MIELLSCLQFYGFFFLIKSRENHTFYIAGMTIGRYLSLRFKTFFQSWRLFVSESDQKKSHEYPIEYWQLVIRHGNFISLLLLLILFFMIVIIIIYLKAASLSIPPYPPTYICITIVPFVEHILYRGSGVSIIIISPHLIHLLLCSLSFFCQKKSTDYIYPPCRVCNVRQCFRATRELRDEGGVIFFCAFLKNRQILLCFIQ